MAEPSSVALRRLGLTDFRNYAAATCTVDGRLVAFVGENGAGKTNLLEAISLTTAGRGLRRAPFAELVRRGATGGWTVSAIIDGPAGETRIGTGYEAGDAGRRVRIDGVDARSSEALLDYIRILWLLPAMDTLLTGPAGDRRRFLDRLVLSIDPRHGSRVADLDKALRSRNRLLEEGGSPAYLDAVEAQVAELGVAVALARRETVALLADRLATQAHLGLPFPRAGIELEGGFNAEGVASDLEDRLRRSLRDGRARDRAAGRTLEGPHRTDLAVTHLGKAMPAAMASTGEQKALLIGLVLGHAELTATTTGMTPVLLLDEVAAHLDAGRRAALFARLDELRLQAFMTGTDRALFEALPTDAAVFQVEHGAVHRL